MYWAIFKAIITVEIPVKVYELSIMLLSSILAAFLIGWMVFGWWLVPVEWEPDKFNSAPFHSQVSYTHLLSEWYAYTENNEEIQRYLSELDNIDEIACYLADGESIDFARKARYIKIAYLKNGYGCIQE